MKSNFLSRFEPKSIRNTRVLFGVAILSITVSLIVGLSDNVPMILLLLGGMILFLFATLNLWKNVTYYTIMMVISSVILLCDFVWPLISEGFAMTVGFISFAGVIVGIIGFFIFEKSWKRLPIGGALASLVALAILTTSIVHTLREIFPGTEWILIGIQLLITILLFSIGFINKRESRLTKILLIFVAVILIILSIWGFYASTLDAELKVFWTLMNRIYAVNEIIIAFIALYACK
jgi:hypothetical protein